MHTESIERWVHDHTFGQDEKKSAEKRTMIVIVITMVTMAVEIAAGIAIGSMALLADALDSFLAIFALLAGKYLRQGSLDPFMGVVGAALVVRWSWGLLRSSAHILLNTNHLW